jgi:hypothetical protein
MGSDGGVDGGVAGGVDDGVDEDAGGGVVQANNMKKPKNITREKTTFFI